MHRRSILAGALTTLGALAGSRARAATETSPPANLKAVYHLSDLEKVDFVLGNIQNHFDGVGGPENVTIALVVHGPALRTFHTASANPDLSRRVQQFSGMASSCRLRQHHEIAECQPEGAPPRLRGRRQGRRRPPRRAAVAGLPVSQAVNSALHRHKIVQSSRLHRIKSEGSNLSGWSCLFLMRIFIFGSPFRPVLTIRSRPRKLLGNPSTDPIEQKQAS